ncbi:MAG TPA: ACT domain-containing protein, partial [Synergistaceae bacterium]|nr:ACT domain-containing protein [Synergistaceae bacterium]
AEALRSGRIEGAAFDVYSLEPLQEGHPLMALDIREKLVLTPHIGANTREGQSAVARIAAKNLAAALKGEPYEHAVNLPFMECQLSKTKKTFLSLSRKLGNLGAQLLSSAPGTLRITLKGELFFQEDRYNFEIPYNYSPFTVAGLKGVLEVYHGADVSYMSAPLIADEREMEVQESREESSTYRNMVVCEIQGEKEKISLAGTVTEEGKQRIVNVNGYWVECVPEGRILLFQNHDRPGVIGRVGSLLGERGINIANFALGRKNGSGLAIGMMQIDQEVPREVLQTLMEGGDFLWAVDVHIAENL